VTISKLASALQVSFPTAAAALRNLQNAGIVEEITGRERDRLYIYKEYMKIIGEGTEPLPRR
jgi:ribosomal protein S25